MNDPICGSESEGFVCDLRPDHKALKHQGRKGRLIASWEDEPVLEAGYPRQITKTIYGPCKHERPQSCRLCGADMPQCPSCNEKSWDVKHHTIGAFGGGFYGCQNCYNRASDDYYNTPG